MLEVIFNENEKDLLRYVSKEVNKSKLNNSIVMVGIDLDYGDISDENKRHQDLQHFDLMKKEDFIKMFLVRKSDLALLIDRASKGENICIWKSNTPSSICGFYYTCHLLRDYACEVSVVEMPEYVITNNKIVCYNSFGEIAPDDFHNFLQYEKELTQGLLNHYSDLWEKLITENSPLRAIVNNRVISVPIDFYDCIIRQYISDHTFLATDLINDVVSKSNLLISEFIISLRINDFISNGELVLIGEENNTKILKKGN